MYQNKLGPDHNNVKELKIYIKISNYNHVRNF